MAAIWIIPNKLWECDGTYYRVVAPNGDGTYRSELLVPDKGHLPFPAFMLLLGLFFFIGLAAGAAYNETNKFGADAPAAVPFSEFELRQPTVSIVTTPTKIELVIDSPENIKAAVPNAYAYSSPLSRPCKIVIPTGMLIIAQPARKKARWGDLDDDHTLAHEILHCLRGSWHPR